jgi:two-component system chemotaxis response regulator CheB
MPSLPDQRFIFIGASSGGVYAMLDLVAGLPARFPAPIFLVQHVGARRSQLAALLASRGPNAAVEATEGQIPAPGTIYIAPPDCHMLLEGGVLRLSHGPKEHHARPAIDPLFRSAALDCGPAAVGVVLTGMLDDGSAGLHAIKACGGTAVVQNPETAAEPSMPRSALTAVDADHVVDLPEMAGLLYRLAQAPVVQQPVTAPEVLLREYAIAKGEDAMQNLKSIGQPSVFSCPDCGGVLFEISDPGPPRYRCHTGHAFSPRSLAATQEQLTDAALWSSLRVLQEKEAMLRRLAERQALDDMLSAQATLQEARGIADIAAALRRLVIRAPSPAGSDLS